MKYSILICLFMIAGTGMYAQRKAAESLDARERSIVIIAAHAARGDMSALHAALNNGLNAGLSVGEVKEMLVQLYAYAGFPRSLNALNRLMLVLAERKTKGIKDADGAEPAPYPTGKTMLQSGTDNQTKLTGVKIAGAVYEFAPAIDLFLKEHLFGAIFGRDNLDWKTRELITISVLAAMDGVEPQLRSHFGVGMHNGLSAEKLSELAAIIETDINEQRGMIAKQVLQSFLDQKPYSANPAPVNQIFGKGNKIENDNFVGAAWLNQLIQADSSSPLQVGNVSFEPGARTKWHYHPAGQILLALDGLGYYQEKGSPKRILRKGDTVRCPANLAHWHGAGPDHPFIQLAITNAENGATVWLAPVTAEEYNNN